MQIMCNFTSPSVSQGNKDQRELELSERVSNEAVDIHTEEYKKVNNQAHWLGYKGSKWCFRQGIKTIHEIEPHAEA